MPKQKQIVVSQLTAGLWMSSASRVEMLLDDSQMPELDEQSIGELFLVKEPYYQRGHWQIVGEGKASETIWRFAPSTRSAPKFSPTAGDVVRDPKYRKLGLYLRPARQLPNSAVRMHAYLRTVLGASLPGHANVRRCVLDIVKVAP